MEACSDKRIGLHNYYSANSFLNELVSNFAMFRGCPARGERNGNSIINDVPAFVAVLI
jgi:hypothetical protein